MANDYALEELGPRAFELLAVALTAATIGTGIEAFGSGKDGGREATYKGRIPWSSGDGGQVWDGYTVLQAKQKEHPSADPARDLNWLKVQIRDELTEWMRPDSKRGRFPNYLIFVTNVRLTSQAGSGGIDQINKYVADSLRRTTVLMSTQRRWARGACTKSRCGIATTSTRDCPNTQTSGRHSQPC